MDRPAYPAVMGDDPRSVSGADTADATPAALRGTQRGMACDCTGAESTDARALRWAGTRTNNARTKMRILRRHPMAGLLTETKKQSSRRRHVHTRMPRARACLRDSFLLSYGAERRRSDRTPIQHLLSAADVCCLQASNLPAHGHKGMPCIRARAVSMCMKPHVFTKHMSMKHR